MSLQEHKLTDYAVSIAGLPDKIENKAQWLKQQFDARTDSEVRDRHNSLIDALDKDLAGRPTNESMAGDVSYISRLCDQNNIPFASNIATAEMLVLGLARGDLDWRCIVNPSTRPIA